MSESRVEVASIEGIEIVKAGKEGLNILFLHPAGQPPLGMKESIQLLTEAGQVFAPNIFDLIASLQRRGNKNPSFADVVNEFTRLDLLNKGERTGLVAASFGGSFAWEYAVQHPDEVDWIIAGSPTGIPLHRALYRWIAEFIKEFVIEKYTHIPGNLRKNDAGSGLFNKQLFKSPSSVLQGLSLAMTDNAREKFPDIKQPTELLWGEKDNYIPRRIGLIMADLLPNASFRIASPYNHLWLAVEPEKLTNPAIQRARSMRAG